MTNDTVRAKPVQMGMVRLDGLQLKNEASHTRLLHLISPAHRFHVAQPSATAFHGHARSDCLVSRFSLAPPLTRGLSFSRRRIRFESDSRSRALVRNRASSSGNRVIETRGRVVGTALELIR